MRSLDDLTRRAELVDRVRHLVLADRRVDAVELFGSLASGKSDKFSDIDMWVHLRRGVGDREFWAALPETLGPIGSAVHGWSFLALGTGVYGSWFLFDDYPLFWGLDIGCRTDEPTDTADLLSTYRWEQIYRMWLTAAKATARSRAALDDVLVMVEKHEPVQQVEGPDTPLEELRHLLTAIERRKIDLGDPYEHLHRRCVALLEEMSDS